MSADIAQQIGRKLTENAPLLTTTTAIASAGAAVFFSAKAGIKAHDVLYREERIRKVQKTEPMTKVEKVKLTWMYYIPTAISLGVCVAAVVMLNRTGERRVASVAAAAAVAERTFTEYRDKVEDRLSKEDVQEIRDEIAQEHVQEAPPKQNIIIGDGDILCLDGFSGRYFESNKEKLRSAVNDLNAEVLAAGYASLTEFYDAIGLDATTISDHVGWSTDRLLEVEFGSALASDGRPCLEIVFRNQPTHGYNSLA